MHREATTPLAACRSRLHGPASRPGAAVLARPTPHPPVEPGAGVADDGGAPPIFLKPQKPF
jgi:hypothetical protein